MARRETLMMHTEHAAVFETPRGCVLRCRCCDRLLVRFGNALLTLDRDELERLRATLRAHHAGPVRRAPGRPVAEASTSCPLVLQPRDVGLAFVFTPDEVAELEVLLEGATLLLDLRAAT